MEQLNKKEFGFSRFTKSLCIMTLTVYVVVCILAVWQFIMGLLFLNNGISEESLAYRLLFFKANYSVFVVIIEILAAVYCIMGAVSVFSVLHRMGTVYLCIEDKMIKGIHMPEPHHWKKGEEFSVNVEDIVSTGISEAKLYGRSVTESLVINTGEMKYVVPGLSDVKAARKTIEKLR